MRLTINGEKRIVDGEVTVTDLLEQFELNAKMVVVEHNGEIIPRGIYTQTKLADGDNLEIVQMMAGG